MDLVRRILMLDVVLGLVAKDNRAGPHKTRFENLSQKLLPHLSNSNVCF